MKKTAKKIQPNEADLSKWFNSNYDGWNERIEPTLGMNPGIPDRLVMTDVGLVPTEFKIATIDDEILWSKEIRPSQIAWHTSFAVQNKDRSALSVILFGVWQGSGWRLFALDGLECRNWEKGFPVAFMTELDTRFLTESFETFCSDMLGY